MMRSLFSGVAGLKAHQTKMDVIGNNIANVNTVGYKSQSVTFSDVLYQTTQSASGANAETGQGGTNAKQIGLGSTVSAISTKVSEAGGSQSTNNPFDLMINGASMFIVSNAGQNYFTKAGNFKVDSAGTLVTTQGYSVMGWQADATGKIQKTNVSPISLYSPANMYAAPVATTANTISGNINKQDESLTTTGGSVSVNATFYDTLGYKYQATISITQDATDKYKYQAAVTGLTVNGKDAGVAATTLAGMISATDGVIEFDPATGALKTPATGKMPLAVSGLSVASLTSPISLDFSKVTCLGKDTSLVVTRGDTAGLNAGRAVGSMSGLGIQKDGKIVATYDNGEQRTIAQIAVANFTNLSGLEKVGDNLFASTLNSGEFDGIGDDVTADGGSFSTGVLEMSNVDLSSEFTEMITTQRGFQANSRIITVSDTMLEELINLKR